MMLGEAANGSDRWQLERTCNKQFYLKMQQFSEVRINIVSRKKQLGCITFQEVHLSQEAGDLGMTGGCRVFQIAGSRGSRFSVSGRNLNSRNFQPHASQRNHLTKLSHSDHDVTTIQTELP
jgi:hypothetical protein